MVRIKNTVKIIQKHHASLAKKTKKVLDTAKAGISKGLIHTGKLKVPFKPASAESKAKLLDAKKGLVKQLKRRWRSGTVAKREIRKLSRTTHLLFPKRPFQRLVREIAQDYSEIRFTTGSMQTIQEAAEVFVTETFHKADMARKHAKRNTVHVKDLRFSRFMTPESMWVMPDSIWEENTFTFQQKLPASSSSLSKQGGEKKKEKKKNTESSDAAEGSSSKKRALPTSTTGSEEEGGKEGEAAGGAGGDGNGEKKSKKSRADAEDPAAATSSPNKENENANTQASAAAKPAAAAAAAAQSKESDKNKKKAAAAADDDKEGSSSSSEDEEDDEEDEDEEEEEEQAAGGDKKQDKPKEKAPKQQQPPPPPVQSKK